MDSLEVLRELIGEEARCFNTLPQGNRITTNRAVETNENCYEHEVQLRLANAFNTATSTRDLPSCSNEVSTFSRSVIICFSQEMKKWDDFSPSIRNNLFRFKMMTFGKLIRAFRENGAE